MQKSLLSIPVVAALGFACATHDGAFVASGTPRVPLYQARKECKEKVGEQAADGSVEIDWRRYDACMADLGWVKPARAPSAPPSPAGGGGGPAY